MKHRLFLFVLFFLILTFSSKAEATINVDITSPKDGNCYPKGATVTVEGTYHCDQAGYKLKFYVDGQEKSSKGVGEGDGNFSFSWDTANYTEGTYTLTVMLFKEGCCSASASVTVTIVGVEMVRLYSHAGEGLVTVPVNNPLIQEFEGGQFDIGDPCAANASERAPSLVIPHNKAKDAFSGSIMDFNVPIEALFNPDMEYPTSFTSKMNWTKLSGPNSGSLGSYYTLQENNHYYYGKKYVNPKKGGVYELQFDIDGQQKTKAYLHLPLAGADIYNWLGAEVAGVYVWGVDHRNDVEEANYSPIPGVTATKVFLTWASISGSYFDYAIAPVNQSETAPCAAFNDIDRMYRHLYEGNAEYGDITVNGEVLFGAKLNNMLWAIFGRSWGYSRIQLLAGAQVNELLQRFQLDSATSQAAINLGCDIWEAIEATNFNPAVYFSRNRLVNLKDSTDELDEEMFWPCPDQTDTSKSTLERPALPLTPDDNPLD